MPGPQDLMALLQQGGGGGAPPPQGRAPMPQGGGGGVPPQALLQKLQELMQDPVAMKGMLAHAQQMGLDPAMLAQGPGNPQAPPTPGPMDMTQGMPPGGPPQPGMQPPPGMQIPPGQEQDMVSQEIDRQGSTWDGEGTPTENDIERLKADPSQTNIDSFNQQFGKGAAEEVLGGGEDKTERDPREGGKGMEGPPDEEGDKEASEY